MPVTDTDWEYLQALFLGDSMCLTVVVEALIAADLLDRQDLIDRCSNVIQSQPLDDPKVVPLQHFLKMLAKPMPQGQLPKHPSRGPQRS